jgi:hypothetical protein
MSQRTTRAAFGKLGAKTLFKPAASNRATNHAAQRIQGTLACHGPLILKVYVALWVAAVLASALLMKS